MVRPAPVARVATCDKPIRSNWPTYAEDEIAEVADILRSGRVNALHHGERCRAFEAAFAARCERAHAIAVANGTLALELALRALGIGAGDEVVVPARSFVASASCVVTLGAVPIFADVDPDSQTLNASTIAAVVTPRTRAVVVVHLAGWPAPMDEITTLAEALGVAVVEDCAQAHGARWNGHPVGSFGNAAAFSFCTDKIISTGGEGGLLVLRDREVWERAWAFKDHGKSPPEEIVPPGDGQFRWLHRSVGSNYRMTEMQAGIGLLQLGKLDRWVADRNRNAAILNRHLTVLPAVRTVVAPPSILNAYYKYYAFIRPAALRPGWSRNRILSELISRGLPAGAGICPEIYREEAFVGTPSVPLARLRVSKMLGETSLMFPCDQTLGGEDVERMAQAVVSVVSKASY
ncbi:MAG: DegT/DnrJ/EryC1/StrS aminotransferase family protein [Sphingomonas sp.]